MSPVNTTRTLLLRATRIIGWACLCGVCGCGGGETAPAEKAKGPAGNALKVTAPASGVQLRSPATASRTKAPPPLPPLKFGEERYAIAKTAVPPVQPEDLFLMEGAEAADQFLAEMPPRGSNSNLFLAETSLGDQGTTPPANIAFPPGFAPLPNPPGQSGPNGLPLRLRSLKDGSEMALVTGGVFVQGSDEGEHDNQPPHDVGLEHFYMDIYEVTAGQYEKYRDTLRREKKAVPRAPERIPRSSSEPVLGINWGEANAYARWTGKELPTEAQWEKAARGPRGFLHPWGNGVPLWQKPRSPGQIDPVGSFPSDSSAYGILDLAGNAREWCADWYSPTYYVDSVRKASDRVQNPTGPVYADSQKTRVVRGGDVQWRMWSRHREIHLERPANVGFRCVLTFHPSRSSRPTDSN